MNIGNGSKGVKVFRNPSRVTEQEAVETISSALAIYPLGEILHVSSIGELNGREALAFVNIVNPTILLGGNGLTPAEWARQDFEKYFTSKNGEYDIVAVISNNDRGVGHSLVNFPILECGDTDPLMMAHEIGHQLGLDHPYDYCSDCVKSFLPESGLIGRLWRTLGARKCPEIPNVMCAMSTPYSASKFSPKDIAKLEREYLGK